MFVDEKVDVVRDVFISNWDSVVLSPFGDGFDHGRGVLDLRGVVGGFAMIGGQLMEVV